MQGLDFGSELRHLLGPADSLKGHFGALVLQCSGVVVLMAAIGPWPLRGRPAWPWSVESSRGPHRCDVADYKDGGIVVEHLIVLRFTDNDLKADMEVKN